MNHSIDKQDPTPAYHQLYRILKDTIINERYKIGSRFPTEISLSQQYDLSRMTVRQALGELENEGFILREQGKGTFVIRSESYPENHLLNIGIVIYKPALEAQWFFPAILSGIHAGFEGKKVNLILIPFDEKSPGIKERDFISRQINERELKELIITAEELDDEEIDGLKNDRFPFLLVNRYPAKKEINYICPDFKAGIKKITEYLISLGHRQIAFIGTLFSRYYLEEMMRRSFLATIKERSLQANPDFIKEAKYMGTNIFSLVKELLQEKVRPTAVICSDDPLAVKVINILREFKVAVPKEISVTGFNDLPLAELSRPTLTTLRTPRYQIGKEAAAFLFRLTANAEAESLQKKVPVELVIRKSCNKVKRQIKN